jgi:hypothetical protein
MKPVVFKLLLLLTALGAGCASPDNACLDNDPSCFTHTQGAGGDPTSTQTAAAGNTNTASQTNPGSATVGTITKTLVVDDFADPNAFTDGENSLSPPQQQSDDNTLTVCEVASDNRLQLQCTASNCYWYTLLAAVGTCLDISQYTHIALTVQGVPGSDATLALQNNSADCTSQNFTESQSVNFTSYTVFDNNPHGIVIPLTAFPNVDKAHGRAIAVTPSVGSTIYLSNIQLVTISPTAP